MRSRKWVLVVIAIAFVGCASEPSVVKDSPPAVPGGGSDAVAVTADGGVVGVAGTTDDASVAACPVCPACEPEEPAAAHDALTLTKVTYADLPGWPDDRHAEAVPSFLRSCEVLGKLGDDAAVGHDGHGGKARQWRKACAAAAKLKAGDDAAAKAMFEAEFVPYQAAGRAGPDGKLTAYFVQELRASRKRGGKYQYPIYDRPADLVMIDLSKHIKDARARRIWGKLEKGEVVPHFTRAEIRKGALAGKGLELMYADDPVDVLFAHIEGSAKAVMDDGSVVWLEFSGKNGRAYRGVGGVLKSLGELASPGSGTMPGIRAWFAANPKRFDEIVDQVHSFVYFNESKRPGAVGSQMVTLTPRRSMAIDRAFVAHSTPIWVETRAPVAGKPGTTAPWRQLLIAQDTGGGILGAVRGDLYWGDDAEAADIGGRMGGAGRYWLLLPKGVTK
ncbi:MAG: MltA domain-containing protein [Deltaproteobacteria bacterium]|nr:MltA domain-containing protein [Deltaproteobacteria bacterium]